MLQYNAALITTGAIKATCCDKIYQELGLDSLADRRCSGKLNFFHKIILGLQPSYPGFNLMGHDLSFVTRF